MAQPPAKAISLRNQVKTLFILGIADEVLLGGLR
jgi:hypothetical protein